MSAPAIHPSHCRCKACWPRHTSERRQLSPAAEALLLVCGMAGAALFNLFAWVKS